MQDDTGLWRGERPKEEPKKAHFKHTPAPPVATLFPAPDGKKYMNSTEYYRSLDNK